MRTGATCHTVYWNITSLSSSSMKTRYASCAPLSGSAYAPVSRPHGLCPSALPVPQYTRSLWGSKAGHAPQKSIVPAAWWAVHGPCCPSEMSCLGLYCVVGDHDFPVLGLVVPSWGSHRQIVGNMQGSRPKSLACRRAAVQHLDTECCIMVTVVDSGLFPPFVLPPP